MDVRATHRRSTSLPSFRRNGTIDEALSLGFSRYQYSRNCLQGIPPLLSNDEVRSLKRQLEDLQKKYDTSCLQKDDEIRSLKKKIEDVQEVHAVSCLQKDDEIRSLKKKIEDVQEVYAVSCLQKDDEIRSLKKKIEDVQEVYAVSCLRKDDEIRSLKKKHERSEKEVESVKRERESLQGGAELRQILSNFLKSNDVNNVLMIQAHVKYPKEFPRETDFLTFMATIRKLMEGDEKMEHKFNCLLEVAKSFRLSSLRWWDEEKGVQFYTLCYNVALWNEFDFHPKIEGETERSCRKKACEGVYKFDGVDVGPLVRKLLPASFTPL